MQKETNTKIAIRGKGSVKDGASRDPKYDYGEEEELHVLISGDTQQDVSCWLSFVWRAMFVVKARGHWIYVLLSGPQGRIWPGQLNSRYVRDVWRLLLQTGT